MNNYLKSLISEGEHHKQDFKFAITDSPKIARSLAAFANTDGGRLLVGVKDNGRIVGVSSDEEYYMIDAAANYYCKPPVTFKTVLWHVEGKTVMEVIIPKSEEHLHKAPTRDGIYKVFLRVNDQNILANRIFINVWDGKRKKKGTLLKLTEIENSLLKYLNLKSNITLTGFQKLTGINRWKAESIITNLLVMNIIKMTITESQCLYSLVMKNVEK